MLSTVKLLPNFFRNKRKITNVIYQSAKLGNDLSTKANAVEEKKVNVDGVDINYVRTGRGEHAVLLLVGLLGSIWSDFKPQIENLNKEKLTIIAWDAPGYGKSRPPNRTFPKNYHERDSTLACNLMKTLGFDKFSIMGWSDAGTTALIFASMYPKNVQKMIAITPVAYISPALIEMLKTKLNIDNWPEENRTEMLTVYEYNYFQDTTKAYIDAVKYVFENNGVNICQRYLDNIKCPSLIAFGETDSIARREQQNYLEANILNSKVVTFQDGDHFLHIKCADEFNSLVYKFLLEDLKL